MAIFVEGGRWKKVMIGRRVEEKSLVFQQKTAKKLLLKVLEFKNAIFFNFLSLCRI
jgi:hypothetical protein